jgi:hypothetical protein
MLGVLGLFVVVLLLVVLAFCWIWGDQELVTKVIFTSLTLATFVLCFFGEVGNWIRVAAQAILAMVIGGSTFGADWLKRRH